MPRNRELTGIFGDLEPVEHRGSGMARSLRAYERSVFRFSAHLMEVRSPIEEAESAPKARRSG